MKKLMTLMLGMALVFGTAATVSFAQEKKDDAPKKEGGKKGGKKGEKKGEKKEGGR